MIRATAVVLAIFLAPVIAQAQQLGDAERTHVVETGETLGTIAQEYLGSASEWMLIYEANRDVLTDPDRIEVGMTLVIPVADAADAEPAPSTVTAVQVVGREAPPQDLDSYEARRELLEADAFEPSGVPSVPVSERTVFYDVPGPETEAATIVFQTPEQIPAIPPGVFQAAGWLMDPEDPDPALGEIVAFSVDHSYGTDGLRSIQLFDMVRVRFDAQGRPAVGDEFLVYDPARLIDDVGLVASPTGQIRVVQVGEGEVVAQVVEGYGQIAVGQPVTRVRTFPLEIGVHPVEVDDVSLEGHLLGFQSARELYLPGDYAFVDIGLDENISLGDELVGLAEDADDWSGRELARFQVVGVDEDHSTVRIERIQRPSAVRPGLRVVLDRRMP